MTATQQKPQVGGIYDGMVMTVGTARFVNRRAALKYYRPYHPGCNAEQVTLKEKEGAISYEKPKLKDGERLIGDELANDRLVTFLALVLD